jgi:hypothetical protein
MPSLLDRPSDKALHLLGTVARGYAKAPQSWPLWQWVTLELWNKEGLDAEEILRGLPTWEYGYRPVAVGAHGQMPKVGDAIPLSLHGMAYAPEAATDALAGAFVVALRTAATMYRGIRPSPTQVEEVVLPGEDFTRTVNMKAGTELTANQLFEVLRREPATWLGVNQQAEAWTWDLTNARLAPYVGVQTVEDYLARLDELVALPEPAAEPEYLPPMALPDAFDHLDLAWRLSANDHLIRVSRVAMAAKLTQPAASVEEFESRCSALADLLNCLNLPSDGGTLHNMKARLTELLGEKGGRAREAVDVLRWVVALRAGQQHQGADARAQQAKVALGLTGFEGNWPGAWDQLRAVTVQALTTIREEISTLIT